MLAIEKKRKKRYKKILEFRNHEKSNGTWAIVHDSELSRPKSLIIRYNNHLNPN